MACSFWRIGLPTISSKYGALSFSKKPSPGSLGRFSSRYRVPTSVSAKQRSLIVAVWGSEYTYPSAKLACSYNSGQRDFKYWKLFDCNLYIHLFSNELHEVQTLFMCRSNFQCTIIMKYNKLLSTSSYLTLFSISVDKNSFWKSCFLLNQNKPDKN